ncbi:hypothetical protein [Pseudomonas sp. EL_65y_Pfl2_R95]
MPTIGRLAVGFIGLPAFFLRHYDGAGILATDFIVHVVARLPPTEEIR